MRTYRIVLVDFEQLFWASGDKVMRPKTFRFNEGTGKGILTCIAASLASSAGSGSDWDGAAA